MLIRQLDLVLQVALTHLELFAQVGWGGGSVVTHFYWEAIDSINFLKYVMDFLSLNEYSEPKEDGATPR